MEISKGSEIVCKELLDLSRSEPSLVGCRCDSCGEIFFPRTSVCARCLADSLSDVDLGSKGKIWSWTIQLFKPKEPYAGANDASFVPYGVGYVELECGIKVESRLLGFDEAPPKIGEAVNLRLDPFHRSAEGFAHYTYAFARGDQT